MALAYSVGLPVAAVVAMLFCFAAVTEVRK